MKNEKQTQLMMDFKKVPEVKFYRISDAANAISVSKSQIWTLIREGIIPVYKISEKITLVKVSELIEYVESFKVGIDD